MDSSYVLVLPTIINTENRGRGRKGKDYNSHLQFTEPEQAILFTCPHHYIYFRARMLVEVRPDSVKKKEAKITSRVISHFLSGKEERKSVCAWGAGKAQITWLSFNQL